MLTSILGAGVVDIAADLQRGIWGLIRYIAADWYGLGIEIRAAKVVWRKRLKVES